MASVGVERVGRYRLMNLLMTGQTSQVWEVMDDERRKRFALKMLLNACRKDRQHVAYLKHEYEVGKDLRHPHVIRFEEFGMHRGSPYVAMEFCTAPNMKFFIQRGIQWLAPLAPDIIKQAASAVSYFNQQGWIHRDIKPDNFLVTPDGEVKLIDFALAQRPPGALAKLLNRRGRAQGTRSYMSPEQIRGQPLDQRSDVYSLGCTIHELIYGKPPFVGFDAEDLLKRHLRTPAPPLIALNNNVTEEFSDLIRRTLSKKRENRPVSAEKFLREFEAVRVFRRMPKLPGSGDEEGDR